MNELVRTHTDLVEDDLAWLRLLLADWQMWPADPGSGGAQHQPAVEHGFRSGPGTVTVSVERASGRLRVIVEDDGAGLDGFLQVGPTATRGTKVTLDIPMA